MDKGKIVCPVDRTLNLINRKWSIQIIRDLFFGKKHFKEFKEDKPELSNKVLSNCLKDLEKNQSPKFATCFIENIVTTISELGIEPVSFNCQFPNETDFTSIEISSSESVAGLPLDKNLLNPVLVDKAIAEGKLFNASEIGSELSIAEIQEFNFDTVQEDGIFYIKANVAGSFISEGQTFDIQLAYPSGFNINFTITHFNGSMLEMKCEIEGEIENQYLISEQTLITVNGTELFVLPGFKTENPISTSNNNLPILIHEIS